MTISEQMATDPGRGRLVVLVGEYGTGKTHCAKSMVRWFNAVAHKLPMDARSSDSYAVPDAWFYRWPEFVDGLKGGDWAATEAATAHTFTVFDDVGAEHDPSRVGLDKLCQVLSKRERRWTMVTTNVLPKLWSAKFDERVASRLIRNSTIIRLDNVPDFSTVN